MTTLADKLSSAGYATHQLGKWHLGMSAPAYLPHNRGFDSSFGYLGGGESHFTQHCDQVECLHVNFLILCLLDVKIVVCCRATVFIKFGASLLPWLDARWNFPQQRHTLRNCGLVQHHESSIWGKWNLLCFSVHISSHAHNSRARPDASTFSLLRSSRNVRLCNILTIRFLRFSACVIMTLLVRLVNAGLFASGIGMHRTSVRRGSLTCTPTAPGVPILL